MADITFQYPPELFNLLVDTIPLLSRSKKDVVLFFQGAGVPNPMLADLIRRVKTDAANINKYEIARTTLQRLNERGEAGLAYRREVLKRVVEFASFDSCWPADQLKAKGLVASIREVVNQKDSFTRMNQAREEERAARLADVERANKAKQEQAAKIEAAKNEFYGLFVSTLTAQQRGKKLESALNNVFRAYGILVKEAFHLVGESGEGIVEQIDGVIELKGVLHFVEHLVRLISRAEARGLIISASDFTDPAIHTCREFLQHKLVSLCHLQELVFLLERQADLSAFLAQKIEAAQIHKNPYFKPLEGKAGPS